MAASNQAIPKPTVPIYISQFPQNELYRLLIDAELINFEGGWKKYEEREPGCIEALCRGAEIAWFQSIENQELDVDLIKTLHRCVTTRVQKLNSDDFVAGEFRKNFTAFPLSVVVGSKEFLVTKAGVSDLLKLILQQRQAGYDNEENRLKTKNDFDYIYKNAKDREEQKAFAPKERSFAGNTGASISFPPEISNYAIYYHYSTITINDALSEWKTEDNDQASLDEKLEDMAGFLSANFKWNLTFIGPAPHTIYSEMTAVIQNYNSRIKEAKSAEQKLEIIAETIWTFEHIHPFRDANTRVFAILLCNRLLVQQGFGLAIFSNPNIFGLYGKKELVTEIKNALENAQNIVQQLKTDNVNFDKKDIPETDRARFKEWSKNLYALAQKAVPMKGNSVDSNVDKKEAVSAGIVGPHPIVAQNIFASPPPVVAVPSSVGPPLQAIKPSPNKRS